MITMSKLSSDTASYLDPPAIGQLYLHCLLHHYTDGDLSTRTLVKVDLAKCLGWKQIRES